MNIFVNSSARSPVTKSVTKDVKQLLHNSFQAQSTFANMIFLAFNCSIAHLKFTI